ncbi:MAG: DNA-3-methyladenine glycosylase 2 family protein [Actinomycetota bacterium]|jgi:3-methyladenine DNA glycosylase/8-oxoguanine DNA glycosylase|nr:DNA-3-methyladenine glycosylase 2 family protein [Actinomycetota bacterium]
MNLRVAIAEDIVVRDRDFATVVEQSGPAPARRPAPVAERFSSLIRSITFQLLATTAAETIHSRVLAACDGEVSVDSVLSAGPDVLRNAGLSRTKASAMLDLAQRTREGHITLAHHGRMSDEAVVAQLTTVHGVGPWTAQMYLMHTLGRRDVWPVGDFGVRYGWSLVHRLDEMVSEKDLRACGDRFIGVRSDVAWYCWRAVHLHRTSR